MSNFRLRSIRRVWEFEELESRVMPSGIATPLSDLATGSQMHTNFYFLTSSGTAIPASSSGPSGTTPSNMLTAYGLNNKLYGPAANGAGQTIAIVDAYNDPNIVNDLAQFVSLESIPAPASFQVYNQSGTNITSLISTNNGTNGVPTDASKNGWAVEESLDVEWSSVIAPGANIILFEANSANPSDLYDAVDAARNMTGVSSVSMSWSGTEDSSDSSNDSHFLTPSNHVGVTFMAATGDSGAWTSGAAQYPAVSPNVVAVGGTTLTTGTGGVWSSEAGWSDSGGGISQYEGQPSFQSGFVTQTSSFRAGPDVAMDANPSSGVPVYDTYDYSSGAPWEQVGGTSLACPMFAGVIAIANQGYALNHPGQMPVATLDGAGQTQTLTELYTLAKNSTTYASNFHDITTGNNGHAAGVGYDLVTGIGSPIGNVLVTSLAGTSTTPASGYADTRWAGLANGTVITDADPVAAGNQSAVIGTNAFASVNAAIAGAAAAGYSTIVVNGNVSSGNYGTFNEAVNVNAAVKLVIQYGPVTFNSLTDSNTGSAISINGVNLTVGADNSTTTVVGPISGTGSLTKVGSGAMTLSGADTYSGATSVSGGALIAGAATGFSSSSAFTVNSGGTLTLNGFNETVTSLTGSGTVQDASSTSATLTFGSANTNMVFSGLLQNGSGSGSLGVSKTGTGTLTLSGTNNSYTGATSASGGTLIVASLANGGVNSSIGASSSATANFVFGGVLQYTGTTISTNRSFTLSAASTITVSSSGATLTIGGSEAGAFGLTTTGPGNLVFTTNGALNNVGSITVSGGNLQIAGETLTTSRKLTIAAGSTVTTTGTLVLSPGSAASTLVSGGTLLLASTTSSTASPDISYGTALSLNDTVTVASAVNLGSSMRFIETFANENPFSAYNGDLAFSGAITGAVTSGLTFYGPSNGTYLPVTVLAGANPGFLGSVTVNSGELVLNNNAALSSANSLTLNPVGGASTVVYLNGHAINIGSLSTAGAAGTVQLRNGSNTAGSLTIAQTAAGTFSGAISDGPNDSNTTTTGKLSLVLAAASNSILALTSANTYSGGTTVNGGTLQVNNASGSGTGTGNVTANANGTLAGTGTITPSSGNTVSIAGGTLAGTLSVSGPISVTGTGTISPAGSGTTGIINAVNVTFASGTTYAVDLNGTTAGAGYDQIISTGLVSLNNATLSLSAGFTASPGNTFDIITDASQAVAGKFNGFKEGATVTTADGQSFSISYVGGTSGHDVVLTALAPAVPPTVTGISPTFGPVAGGTSVTVTGVSFTNASAVDFGGVAAMSYTVNSDTSITAVAPGGTDTVDVTVTTPSGGTSATSSSDQFTYSPTVTSISPTSGSTAGGDSVTITGMSFADASAVNFGGTAAMSYTVNSDTSITAVAPGGTDTVDVTVTTPSGGTSATSSSDQFTYSPTVTSISSTSGSTAGGDSVTITGLSFTNASAVNFGGVAAMSYTVNSDTSITAVAPGGADTVDVTVTTPSGGTSATSSDDQYTYVAAGTTVTSNPVGPLTTGEPVNFTATIAGGPSDGTVSFYLGSVDPANQIGDAVNVSAGTATSASDSNLPVGNDTIIAVYSGGTTVSGSQGSLSITVSSTPLPAVTSFTVNGSGTSLGAASASESADGTTATITADGLNFLGFYPGESVNVSGFTTQTGFNGTYVITATSGNSFSYADALPGSVTDTGGTAYPAVEQANSGTLQVSQASMVNSLVVVFNEAVTINSPSTAFTLALKTFNNLSGGNPNAMMGDATTVVTATNPSGDGMTWVLQFSGGTTEAVTGGSIGDGDYFVNLAAGSVAAASDPTTTNAGYQNAFYRLFGDISGNGVVANPGLNQLKLAFGAASISSPNYNAAVDYFGTGVETNPDLNQFKQRFGDIWSGLN